MSRLDDFQWFIFCAVSTVLETLFFLAIFGGIGFILGGLIAGGVNGGVLV